MLQNQTEIYILQETVAEFTWITSETKNKTNKIQLNYDGYTKIDQLVYGNTFS